MKKFFTILLLFLLTTPVFAQEDMAPHSKSAFLMEFSTGKIIYEKNSHEKLSPASMTKIMTLLLVMEELESGRLKESDSVIISDNASKMGGSQIFLQVGSKILVRDLLKAVAIASANDAAVALAEKVAGTESAFVEMMNKKAKELKLNDTLFQNPHGLDAENHYSSAYDMGIMGYELIKHSKVLEYTKIYEEYLTKDDGTKIWLVNTNKLVRFYEGIDGLKTGFTSSAGYCLTATGLKNNLRFIAVVMGADTSTNRSSDILNLLNYGFNSFKLNTIVSKDKILGKIRINQGKLEYGTLVLESDANELLKNTDKSNKYKYNVVPKKVRAPIKYGDSAGVLEIINDQGKIVQKLKLTIKEDIKKASYLDYLLFNIKEILSGKNLIKM